MVQPIHNTQTLFSWRNVPSWLLLAFSAGAVNAAGLLLAGDFVSHVTGTATRLGSGRVAAGGLVVLLAFIAGAIAAVIASGHGIRSGERPRYFRPLLMVALVLAIVGLAGTQGLGGERGVATLPLLASLAFAMGMQNAAVSTATALAVRTTHMTGPATDLGVHVATAIYTSGDVRSSALRSAALRGGKLASFILGAAVMVPTLAALGTVALLVPAAAIVSATGMSFVPGFGGLRATGTPSSSQS